MDNQLTAPTTPSTTRPRRRLKPSAAARFAHAAPPDVSRLYDKPVEQLTEQEIRRMKQAFLSGI